MQEYVTKSDGKRAKAGRVNCSSCDKSILKPLYLIKTRENFYCNKECLHNKKKDPKDFFNCYSCDKEIFIKKSRQSKSKSGLFFCSTECKNKEHRIGGAIQPPKYGTSKLSTNDKRECRVCGKDTKRTTKQHCSKECSSKARKKTREIKVKGGDASSFVCREYLIEAFGAKCMDCGCEKANPYSNLPVIELEHMDGNSKNNNLKNLKLLCPTCHAMTPTYKALNVGKGRHNRMKRYKDGKSY